MIILGISAYYHDSAACVLKDGELIAAAQEERFTRNKHDADFPTHAVNYCLEHAGVTGAEIDYVGFYDRPLLKFDRILETYLAVAPLGFKSFVQAVPLWIKEKLWIATNLDDALGEERPLLFAEHHESHAASAFFPSPFERAAILTVDGVGEWATTTFGRGEGNRVEILKELRFPHSLGLLYSAFTYYCGFRVNSGEYKLMGLAPYGEPRFADVIREKLIDLKPDGSFRMDMRYFDYLSGLRMTSKRFDALFGAPPRAPEAKMTQHYMDVAASCQLVTEEILLKMAAHVHAETGEKDLCMAGGVALNCVANGKILRQTPFERIFVQPAAGDAGGAVGVAYVIWHHYLDQPRTSRERDAMKAAYLGPAFSREEIKAFLDGKGVVYHELSEADIPARVAELLASENVVGYFNGRMEFGPRALGSRSILGDARSPKMQSVMNLKIKYRESFRPFAPSVLRERAADYFDIDCESPYMLLVADVSHSRRRKVDVDEKSLFGIDKLKILRSEIPAVTHVNYSARLHTVDREDNPSYHAIISEFEKRTGCPVIVNTSFNVRGEPIVCTPEDAFNCFMRTEMDYLVLGTILLDKKEMPTPADVAVPRMDFEPD